MSKFIESNPANAEIHLDVKKKKCSFSYPPSLFDGLGGLGILGMTLLLYWNLFLSLIACTIALLFIWKNPISFLLAFLLWCGPAFLVFLSKFILATHFGQFWPKLNASIMTSLKGNNSANIYPGDIKTKYTIHNFDNILLEYKTTGDFADKLKSIDITPVFIIGSKRIPTPISHWKAVISFTKTPKNGEMELKWL